MSFNPATGVYVQVAGAITASPGAVIQSAVWNNIHSDMGTALSNCLTRFGNDNVETSIVAAATTDLSQASTTNSLRIKITGSTGISSFGAGANLWFIVRFSGTPLITNGAALACPGGVNLQVAAGDEAIVTSDAGGNWRFVSYLPASGTSPISPIALQNPTFRNVIGMAGGFEVWQRGAGGSASIAVGASATAYTADRWYLTTGANQASVVSAQTGLTNGSQLCAQVQRNSAQTGATAMLFGIPLTIEECARLRGQFVAISFTVVTGANWSPASGTLVANLFAGTGTNQKAGAAGVNFSGLTTPITLSENLAVGAAAARYTAVSTVVFPANTTQAELQFTWTPVGTAGAADWFQLDDVQIEAVQLATSPATAFERWSFEECLAHCLRHYRKTFPYGTAPAQGGGIIGSLNMIGAAVTKAGIFWAANPPMRATGTYTTFNPSVTASSFQDLTAAATNPATSDPGATASPLGIFIQCSTVTAAGDLLAIHVQCDAGL